MCTCARRQGEGRGRVEGLEGDVHLRKAARGGQRKGGGIEGRCAPAHGGKGRAEEGWRGWRVMCTCARQQGEGKGRVEGLKGDVHLRKTARGGQRKGGGIGG